MANMLDLADGAGRETGVRVGSANPMPVISGTNGYTLASNQTLAAGAGTAPVTGVARATYILDISGTFANGASLSLQYLASDGATWRNGVTGITGPGTDPNSYQAAANATVRLYNAGSASVTGLYGTLG